jgi:hypothetical protein
VLPDAFINPKPKRETFANTTGPSRSHIGLVSDEKFVRSFLASHCADCHDDGVSEGDFELKTLTRDDIAGRVAYASIYERLRAGDMPPPSEPRPKADEVAKVVDWIAAKLDAPLPAPPAWYPVKEKPIDGNRLPHAILFGGPRGPSVPPPPRLWRLSPDAYSTWTAVAFNVHGLQQPFGLIQESGFRDFAALYAPDEGATSLLLSNAEQIVAAQVRGHQLVNVNETPAAAKEQLWPDEGRIQTASVAEQQKVKGGLRVRQGSGVFAPLMHPEVKGNGTMLDNSLIIWMSDSAEEHHGQGIQWPLVLVGSLGGKLKSAGRYLQFPKYNTPGHRTLGNFYLSLLHAVGDRREKFGDSDSALKDIDTAGPLTEILA